MNYSTKNSINNILFLKNIGIEEDSFQVIEKFFEEKDISQNTKNAIILDLKHFLKWFVDTDGQKFSFKRLIADDVIQYRQHCSEVLKHKPSTINRRLINIKQFCTFAFQNDERNKNSIKKIKLLGFERLAPNRIEKSKLRALIKEVKLRANSNKKYIRDVLIIELMCRAGLRVSEVVNLTVDDISIRDRKGELTIRNSKRNKTREVPLSGYLIDLINEYIKIFNPSDYLVLGQRGRLTPIAVNKLIEVYAKKVGIKLSPHALRHAFAYNYLEQNPNDIVGLRDLLGHRDLNTTAIYTRHSLDTLQERVEKIVY